MLRATFEMRSSGWIGLPAPLRSQVVDGDAAGALERAVRTVVDAL